MIDPDVDAIVDLAFRDQSDDLYGKGVESRIDGYIRNHDHRTEAGRRTRAAKEADERQARAQAELGIYALATVG